MMSGPMPSPSITGITGRSGTCSPWELFVMRSPSGGVTRSKCRAAVSGSFIGQPFYDGDASFREPARGFLDLLHNPPGKDQAGGRAQIPRSVPILVPEGNLRAQ